MEDGSLPNESIIEATKGGNGHGWAEPVVAMRKKGTDLFADEFDDATLDDFRHIIDHLVIYDEDNEEDLLNQTFDLKAQLYRPPSRPLFS